MRQDKGARRRIAALVLLAGVALSATACTGSALADAGGRQSGAATPSPQPTPRAEAVLAGQAYDYIRAVQADERRDSDEGLPQDACPATFGQLETAAEQAAVYRAEPALASFLAAAADISWACEMQQVKEIRAAILRLSDVAPGLIAVAG